MTTRNQYIVFLMFWVASIIAELALALWLGFDITSTSLQGTLLGFGLVALVPAGAVHFGLMKTKNLYTRWQVSRGKDVYEDRNYEDCDGYLHITPISESQKQKDLPLSELISDVEQVGNDWSESTK